MLKTFGFLINYRTNLDVSTIQKHDWKQYFQIIWYILYSNNFLRLNY